MSEVGDVDRAVESGWNGLLMALLFVVFGIICGLSFHGCQEVGEWCECAPRKVRTINYTQREADDAFARCAHLCTN